MCLLDITAHYSASLLFSRNIQCTYREAAFLSRLHICISLGPLEAVLEMARQQIYNDNGRNERDEVRRLDPRRRRRRNPALNGAPPAAVADVERKVLPPHGDRKTKVIGLLVPAVSAGMDFEGVVTLPHDVIPVDGLFAVAPLANWAARRLCKDS
jgi:hypothetical protein